MQKYKFEQIAINSTAKKKPEETDKECYIGLEHLDTDCLTVNRWGSELAPKGDKLLMKKGDVLFGKRRAYQKKVAIAPFDGIFSAHGMVLRPNEDVVDEKFFPFFIGSDYFLEVAIKISVGSLSPTVNWRDLKVQEFNLPSMERQREVADILWAMNDTLESYKVLLAKTDEMVKSLFIERFGDVENNPKGIRVMKWNDVFLTKTGKLDSNAMVEGGQYPFFTCAKEAYWIDKYAFDCEALLLAGNNAVGVYDVKHYKGKFNAYQRTYVLQLKDDSWSYEFFKNQLELKLEYLRVNSIGSNTRYLTMKILEEIAFLVPDTVKQNEWARFIQQSDKSKFALQQSIDSLQKLMKATINQEFMG